VQALLDFAKGPLFRLTFLIMVLGLARLLIMDIYNAVVAYRNAGDKNLNWSDAARKTLQWLFPIRRVLTARPFYSLISILFHIGLIIVPIFLLAHIQLWKSSLGMSWWSLPVFWADWLTIMTIATGLLLIIGRLASKNARHLSRPQDYIWPLLLILPFLTGYICASTVLAPGVYQTLLLIHILSGELIFVLIPFTKVAHCVLMPLSQFIIALAWKFPARVDDKICATLNKKGARV
jgi:nitrate reductase gamma subunit